jgi:hypothetical protein
VLVKACQVNKPPIASHAERFFVVVVVIVIVTLGNILVRFTVAAMYRRVLHVLT